MSFDENVFTVGCPLKNGIYASDLFLLLKKLRSKIGDEGLSKMPVSLCVDGIESYNTRIIQANNEGDNSLLWLHMSESEEKRINNALSS